MANITKSQGYDILADQVKGLKAENEHLKKDIAENKNRAKYFDKCSTELTLQLTKAKNILSKMCQWHEKQATWDKGDNGYYEAKEFIKPVSIKGTAKTE